ncbi:hypothetical protein TgHK011_004654 [Trichoderma gracile]|nr:hypothetical protein TgHK011_004654 [Trichoderma gracile]
MGEPINCGSTPEVPGLLVNSISSGRLAQFVPTRSAVTGDGLAGPRIPQVGNPRAIANVATASEIQQAQSWRVMSGTYASRDYSGERAVTLRLGPAHQQAIVKAVILWIRTMEMDESVPPFPPCSHQAVGFTRGAFEADPERRVPVNRSAESLFLSLSSYWHTVEVEKTA